MVSYTICACNLYYLLCTICSGLVISSYVGIFSCCSYFVYLWAFTFVVVAVIITTVYALRTIAHMDIKPENILLGFNNATLQVKLCDFGLCSIMHSADSTVHEFCGSPGFFAPECYLSKKFCGFKADIFSLACVTLELLLSQSGFNDHWIRAYDAIKRKDGVQLGK